MKDESLVAWCCSHFPTTRIVTAYTDDDVTAVALAILRVSAPDAEPSDLTDVDLDEARAALGVIFGARTIR